MWIVHDTRRSTGRADPRHIVDLASHGLTIYWQLDQSLPNGSPDIRNLALEPYEIIDPPAVTEYDNVKVTIDVSQRFLDVLASAKTFQVVTTEPDDDGLGFNLIELNLDREKVAGIERSCK